MSEKPFADDKVISLADVHKRVEAAVTRFWKVEAERLQVALDDLREQGVKVDRGYVIDVETLVSDPRLPKLTPLQWRQLLGSTDRSTDSE
jgi:hypothetical protein